MDTEARNNSIACTMARLFAVIAVMAAVTPLAGQQSRVVREGASWVEEINGALPATQNLTVKLDSGHVTVQGVADSKISYTVKKRVRSATEAEARRQFASVRLSATQTGDTALLESSRPGGWRFLDLEVLVRAPRSTRFVRAMTNSGNESLKSLDGRVEALTGGGNVHLDDQGGPASVTSGGGEVDVGNARGQLLVKTGGGNVRVNSVKGNLDVSTGGGNITVGSAAQSVTAQTGGGGIDVQVCDGPLIARTGGGSLELGQVGGKATLESAGGNIRLASADGPVVANTGSGAIELLGLAQGARVQTGGGEIIVHFRGGNFHGSSLQTPSGDVIVYLGPNLKATVRAQVDIAGGHHVRSDFPEIVVRSANGRAGPRSFYAEGNLNGGGALLLVRTAAGNIEFRRPRK